jgi:hypothetical protein
MSEAKLALVGGATTADAVEIDHTDPEIKVEIGPKTFTLVYNLGAIKEFFNATKINLFETGMTSGIVTDPDKLTKLLLLGLADRHGGDVTEEYLNKHVHMKNWTYVVSKVARALDIIMPKVGATPPLAEGGSGSPGPSSS